MLTNEERARAARHAQRLVDVMNRSAKGGPKGTMAVPEYDSQEDLDRCHPEERGTDFRKFNEFNTEILNGLIAKGVSAKRVTYRYAEFSKWLGSTNPINPSMRGAYGAYLLAEAAKERTQ